MRAPLPVLAAAVLSCLPVACAPDGGDSAAPANLGTCDDPDASTAVVLRQMYFARSNDGVGWGFDLDGFDSAAGDANGCGKLDLTDPEGNPGIDNAFAGLLPTLEATEAAAVEGLLQDSISSGELLMMVELTGVDDPMNDDCVTARFGPAVGTPLVGTDGTILDGQTFAWDPDEAIVTVEGVQIVDGTAIVDGIDFNLQFAVLAATFDIAVSDGALRLDLDEDGGVSTGFFGGGFSVDYMLDVLNGEAIDAGLKDILNQALPLAADLSADGTTCRHMSVTLEYEAIPAYLYSE
jgi:hypothetical protein